MKKTKEQILFLDTNILLHFQLFTEIDWAGLLGMDHTRLIFSPIIVKELDKKKYDAPSHKLKDRAQMILSKLKDVRTVGNFICGGKEIPVVFLAVEPMINWEFLQLDPNTNDDRLIGSVLQFQKESSSELTCIAIVTNDLGLQLKAQSHGIRTVDLPDSYRLTLVDDPVEINLRKTKAELEKLQAQLPKLELRFASDSSDGSRLIYKFGEIKPRPTKEEIQQKVKTLETELLNKTSNTKPKVDPYSPFGQNMAEMIGALAVPPEWIKMYREKVENYIHEYPDYIIREYDSVERINRSVQLRIKITNIGSAPAEDTDVFLFFPDGFDLTDKEPKLFNIPKVPSWGYSILPGLNNLPDFSRTSNISQFLSTPPKPSNVSSPHIKKTNSYEVRVRVRRIKHHFGEELDPIWVIFPNIDAACSFNFRYEIITSNYPDKFVGSLSVIIENN